jgi:hypothetical protein
MEKKNSFCIPKNFLEISERMIKFSAQRFMNRRNDCSKLATDVNVELMASNPFSPASMTPSGLCKFASFILITCRQTRKASTIALRPIFATLSSMYAALSWETTKDRLGSLLEGAIVRQTGSINNVVRELEIDLPCMLLGASGNLHPRFVVSPATVSRRYPNQRARFRQDSISAPYLEEGPRLAQYLETRPSKKESFSRLMSRNSCLNVASGLSPQTSCGMVIISNAIVAKMTLNDRIGCAL